MDHPDEGWCSEGYAIGFEHDEVEETEEERYDRLRMECEDHRRARRAKGSKKYQAAKAAPVGSLIKCAAPGCGKKFIKKSYQQVFCSNKGRGNCKDRYWNP